MYKSLKTSKSEPDKVLFQGIDCLSNHKTLGHLVLAHLLFLPQQQKLTFVPSLFLIGLKNSTLQELEFHGGSLTILKPLLNLPQSQQLQ